MSIPTGYPELRVNVERAEKIVNKSQIHFPQFGDDNANQISSTADQKGRGLIEDIGYSKNSIPPLVSQSDSSDKLVFWGSEQLLESKEIHTFFGNKDQDGENEEEDDGGSMRDGKDEGPMSISSSSTASSASVRVRRNDNDSNKVESKMEGSKEVQKRIICHSIEEIDTCVTTSTEKMDSRSDRAGERERKNGGLKVSKSETNVFVSSLSAIPLSGSLSSALDSPREVHCLYSVPNTKTNPFRSKDSTTSAQTRRRAAALDGNQNSPPSHPQEKHPQFFCHDQRQEENHERNGFSSDGGLGQRRKAGFEEIVMPPRRQQLVRPLCQTEMGRARSLDEASAQHAETRTPSCTTSTDSQSNGSNRRFIKSTLREPSDYSAFYNIPGVLKPKQSTQEIQRQMPEAEKMQGAATWRNSSPSNPFPLEKRAQTQLTYRRNCSSPNRKGFDSRSSTPPDSPLRTPQGSPRRQPSMYLVSRNVSGVAKHTPSPYNPAVTSSAQGIGNSGIKAPVRTTVSTSGIPKAPLNNQPSSNHNSSPKESSPSPKLKPKGVRPKIITYVRKNPQFKLQGSDGPYQVSSLPSRLSACTHQTGTSKDNPKDPSKPNIDARGPPVISASNPLYDKFHQEMQTSIFPPGMLNRSMRPLGHTHTVPPAHTHSHTAPPKLGSKADNICGPPSEVSRRHSLYYTYLIYAF